MIPVYKAIEFDEIMDGGSTSPWRILADVNGVAVPFVMKLYDSEYQKHEVIMKEVIASVLASEFEIGKTEPALIEITKEFVRTLKQTQKNQLSESGYKTKFATKLVEPVVLYSASNPSKVIDKVDKGNIYAFDNLILHRDRRLLKPNLLLGETDYYLIDNETCLSMAPWAKSNLEENNLNYLYKGHLLLNELKRFHDRASAFDTFELYLRDIVDFSCIAFVPDLLNSLHHPCNSFNDIDNYLKTVKQLSSRFVNHLRMSVQ